MHTFIVFICGTIIGAGLATLFHRSILSDFAEFQMEIARIHADLSIALAKRSDLRPMVEEAVKRIEGLL